MNEEEEASTDPNVTPKQSIIKGASLVVYPKGHVEIYIPKDVVFHILTFTRRGQLSVCSRVCKLWRLLSSDPYFGWCEVHLHRLSGKYYSEYVYYSVELCSGASVEGIYNNLDVKIVSEFKGELADGTKIQPHSDIHPVTSELFETCKDHPRLWRWDVYKKTVTNIKNPTRASATLGAVNYELRFEVNVKEFEKLVFEMKTVPGQDAIINAVKREQSAENQDTKFTEPRIPQRSLRPQKQPYGFKTNIKLYKYQLDAIAWMKSIEDDVDEVYDFCYLTPWRKAQSTVLFDLVHTPATLVPVSEVKKHLINYTACGGVLGDEMGLGKTMEMIGLILANPGTPIEDVDEDAEGEADAEDKEDEKEDEKEADNNEKDAATDDLFVTDATLVLCPSHLVHQWTEEIQKRTNDVLNIVTLTTIGQVKGYTYKDIKNADVVIMSYQLMKNPQYFHIGHALQARIKNGDECYRQSWVNAQLRRVRKAAAPLRQSKPICDHFYWRRIVMDEAHEIIPINFYQNLLSALQSKFRWMVSATPFPTRDAIYEISHILAKAELKSLKEKLITGAFVGTDFKLNDFMLSNLYWRNTKESVKDEYQIPPLVEDLVLLDFTDVERIGYQYAPESQKRELCCYHGTSSMTLSAYKTSFLDAQKSTKQRRAQFITNNTRSLKEEQEKLAKPVSSSDRLYINSKIESLTEEIRDAQLMLNKCVESIRLMNAVKSYDGPNVPNDRASLPHPNNGDQKMEEANTTKSFDEEEEYGKREERQKEEQEDKMETKREEEKEQQRAEQEKKETDKRGAINDQHGKVEEERGEEEEEGDKLTEEEVGKMTVAQLNIELKKRRIEASAKAVKKVLQKLLLTSLSTPKEKKTSNKKADAKREQQVNSEEATAEDEGKKLECNEEELEEMTIVQLKALLKKRGIEVPKKAVKRVLVDLALKNSKAEKTKEPKSQSSSRLAKTMASKRKLESVQEASVKKVKKSKKTEEEGKKATGAKTGGKEGEKKTPLGIASKHQKFREAQVLKSLVEQYGTKLGNLIHYLRKLWADDPNARVIIFSQFSNFLDNIATVLSDNDIESTYVEGNIMRREKALKSFKKADSDIRVILMSLESSASGSNLIAATHIILMDPVKGSKKEALATEQQAIGRSHRQGQDKQVTIVRFIIKKTVEYDTYVQNYLADEGLSLKEDDSSRPELVHSNSIDAVLATTPTVRRSKSIIEFISNLQ